MMECWTIMDKPKGCKLERSAGRFMLKADLAFTWSLRDLPVEVLEKLTKIRSSRIKSDSPNY
jgi:hypothetical protein